MTYLQMPAGEVQITSARVYGYGARVLDARLERAATRAVQLGHLEVLAVPVEPIQLPTHPVDRDALQAVAVVSDDLLALRAAHSRSVNRLGAHVAEIQPVVRVVKVQSDHVEQILVAERVLGGVQRHVPHVVLVREDQPRTVPVPAFARPLVLRPIVPSLVAFAVERPGYVHAELRARARHFRTLVYVLARFAVLH